MPSTTTTSNDFNQHTTSSPLRSLLSVLSVSLLIALLINVLLSYDIPYLQRSPETPPTHLINRLNDSALNSLFEDTLTTVIEKSNFNISADDVISAIKNEGKEEDDEVEQFKHLRWMQSQVNYSEVWMSAIEIFVILRHLEQVDTYLEWGSGGSTINYAQFAKKQAFSIEHDARWCEEMKQRIVTSSKLVNLIKYHCVPVEKGYKSWGLTGPFEEGTYIQFKDYVNQIDQLGVDVFDFVLVDGRARMPAAVKALSYIGRKSVVALHDAERAFREKRGYERIWNYYDAVDSVGGIQKQGVLILRRKKDFSSLQGDHKAVQKILDDYYS